jgi:hypothetical protein
MDELAAIGSTIQYGRAVPRDYPAILRLNTENFIANLKPEDRRDGFLSAIFTPGQVSAMAEDLGIMVARAGEVVIGFLCAFRNDFNHGSPVVAKMIESYDRANFDGKPLTVYKTYAYGPVCIDRGHRGKGVLRGLYEAQKQDLAGRFDVGVALIARDNPHSMAAHIQGLGMVEAGEFEVNGKIFATVAFRLPGTNRAA